MKKIILLLAIGLVIFTSYTSFINSTHFNKTQVYFDYQLPITASALGDTLVAKKILYEKWSFLVALKLTGIESKLQPGKFLVKKGTSLYALIRMLKNNQQATVKLVLNKVRTRGELAKLIATTFEKDSLMTVLFLNNNDSLKVLEVDTTQLFTLLIPNTYEFYWNSSLVKILEKLKGEQIRFWRNNNRIEKAANKGLSLNQVYTLASIVEEETNFDTDKTLIASVYLNRLQINMPLQACPSIKYAMQDFTITRIYEKYLSNPSPYNTYLFKGLTPGPICTPAPKTIDLVLNAPKTDYLYFVAKADFSGYHHFSTNYAEHQLYADQYQRKLDEYQLKNQQRK